MFLTAASERIYEVVAAEQPQDHVKVVVVGKADADRAFVAVLIYSDRPAELLAHAALELARVVEVGRDLLFRLRFRRSIQLAHQFFRFAHRQRAQNDVVGGIFDDRLVFQSEQRLRVTFGQRPLRHVFHHHRRQIEKAERVCDGASRAADAPRDFLLRQSVALYQRGKRLRFFDRIEIFALDVLNERYFGRFFVVRVYDRTISLPPEVLSGFNAYFDGDQLNTLFLGSYNDGIVQHFEAFHYSCMTNYINEKVNIDLMDWSNYCLGIMSEAE